MNANKLREQIVTVSGPGIRGRMMTPPAHRFVSRWIEESVRRSARMRILAISRRVGRPSPGLQSLWTVFEGGFTKDTGGALGLVYYAPLIKDAAPKLVDQPPLFGETLNPDDTVFDLLNDALHDVALENGESNRFDKDLLVDFERLTTAHGRGVDELDIGSMRYAKPTVADKVLGEKARSLLATTPAPQRVRLAGMLDMVRVSDSAFELLLREGAERVRAVWISEDPEELGHLLKKDVLVEGDLVYKPNGKPLRLEAELIRGASEKDQIFARPPRPAVHIRRTEPPNAMTFKQLIGSWPGPETDDELRALLEEAS